MVNEKMGGSDCWWFEYGGSLDTIGRLQDITLELKRLVMGVWNYIKIAACMMLNTTRWNGWEVSPENGKAAGWRPRTF